MLYLLTGTVKHMYLRENFPLPLLLLPCNEETCLSRTLQSLQLLVTAVRNAQVVLRRQVLKNLEIFPLEEAMQDMPQYVPLTLILSEQQPW